MREPNWLQQHRCNVTSQTGEDGVLAEVLKVLRLNSGPHWCVEIGAADGLTHSNTYVLRRAGWRSVQIEGNSELFDKLRQNCGGEPGTLCVQAVVRLGQDNGLDAVIAATPCPPDPALLVLDVDGCEWHLWNRLQRCRPRVMLVEYNHTMPPSMDYVQPEDLNVRCGSSLTALVRLGKAKGYELVACTEFNAVFVRQADFPAFAIADNSPWTLARHNASQWTFLVQTYVDTVHVVGNRVRIWGKGELDAKGISAAATAREAGR